MSRVAIITGGASGIGLAVATGLSKQQSNAWKIHLLDANPNGNSAVSTINATFHRCDVTDYNSLSTTFQAIYLQHNRVDFVFANAGIVGPMDFMSACTALVGDDSDAPPPPAPNMAILEVNLKGVVTTSWLAMHYFARTKRALGTGWEGNLAMTSSIAGVYSSGALPMYSAAKAGVLALTRSLAQEAYSTHSVRVNCICPGYVKTAMTANTGVPEIFNTPIEKIIGAIVMLIEGKAATDSAGVKVDEGRMYGQAVEVTRDQFYFKAMPPYSDRFVAQLIGQVTDTLSQ